MGVLLLVSSLMLLFSSTTSREPHCSKFHYEEQLQEKVIRGEIKVEQLVAEVVKIKTEAEAGKQAFKDKIETIQSALNRQTSGDIFTRWGRKSCPSDNADIVYSGVVGGGKHNDPGGPSNLLCLPTEPQLDKSGLSAGAGSFIYGTEYRTVHGSLWKHITDNEAPCAVCMSRGRSVVMIPGRNTCYPGWRVEYSGYLMSGYHGHTGNTNPICIDAEPETTTDSDNMHASTSLLYFVKASCGTLKCPPYENGTILTCVVCSM